MTNIEEQEPAFINARPRLINKPILTPQEAADFLGCSRRTLKAYNVPRHILNHKNQWYLVSELVEFVQKLPMRGEMPTQDEYVHEIRVI